MAVAAKNGKYFWLLNLFVVVIILSIAGINVIFENSDSQYRLQLNEVPHYISEGFTLDGGLTGALEIPAGSNAVPEFSKNGGHLFMHPGESPYKEFTITATFDYASQYDALKADGSVIPGIMLPGLGDSYEIYLNERMIASDWHVSGGVITCHKKARGVAYPINPEFFIRGQNVLVFRVYGEAASADTGLTVTNRYVIDDIKTLSSIDYPQIVFAGIYIAVAVIFAVFFLLYREKRLNLWFSVTAISISMYTFCRMGAFQYVFQSYETSLRLRITSLFTFMYFVTVLMYTCAKNKFNFGMKAYTGIYVVFFAAVFLPGRQFTLDLIKVFFLTFAPILLYAFVFTLCIPFVKEARASAREGGRIFTHILDALSGTLRGNMLVGAFIPLALALFDQIVYVVTSYQDFLLSQYGYLLFVANVTFAIASDNAKMHSKLITLSEELRALVSERESELAKKSGEVEEAKTAQKRFCEAVSREIRTPLGEIIGAIELQALRSATSQDTSGWLNRLLEAQRNLRKRIDDLVRGGFEYTEAANPTYDFESEDTLYNRISAPSSVGGTRHLFVINPKSFVTLKDLKNFLLSIEMCFSAGHRAEYKIYISRYPRDAYSAVYRYLSATSPDETARVYPVGGDGILFDCLNGVAHFPNAELAPIPYGNANDFVRSFGEENMHLFRDIKLMSKAPSRLMDVILCGEQYALCSCSIGIEARAVQVFSDVIEQINSSKARFFVPLMYKLGAVKSLLDGTLNSVRYRVEFDGEDFSGKYLFISVGNIALNGGSCIPNPLAVADDGMLDVITCKSASIISSLKMLPAYTSGHFCRYPSHFKHRRLKEMHCESDGLMSVILDGETFYTRKLDLKILPDAVKIVSPNGIGLADYSQSVKGAAK